MDRTNYEDSGIGDFSASSSSVDYGYIKNFSNMLEDSFDNISGSLNEQNFQNRFVYRIVGPSAFNAQRCVDRNENIMSITSPPTPTVCYDVTMDSNSVDEMECDISNESSKENHAPEATNKKRSRSKKKSNVISKPPIRRHTNTDEKKAILKMFNEDKMSVREICKETQIKRGQIYNIIKNQAKIMKKSEENHEKHRKHDKVVTHPEFDKAIYLWVVQQRTQHVPLTSDVIRAKANDFHKELCLNDECQFQASYGWFVKFKERHGLKVKKMHGEKLSADLSQVDPFKTKFIEIITTNELELDEIFNTDESAIYFKMIPNKTVALSSEKKLSGFKVNKDRFTFMPCSNVDGSLKLDLQIIGTAKNPRCFNKQPPKGVVYYSSKNAWQTRQLFKDWFYNHFVPSVREFARKKGKKVAKALLVLDNCSAHNTSDVLTSDDGLIQCLFLPPNVTSEIQPMDQNVIVSIKNNYKKKFLQYLLVQNEESFYDAVKSFSLLKAINYLRDAWNMVSPLTITKSWSKLLNGYEPFDNYLNSLAKSQSDSINDDLSEFVKKFEKRSFSKDYDIRSWIENNENIPTSEEFTDRQIINFVKGVNENIDEDYTDEEIDSQISPQIDIEEENVNLVNSTCDQTNEAEIISHIDALIDVLDDKYMDKIIFLRDWRDEICNKM